jgi:ferredoxin/menaquinone-dependent protoporphyrinogen IX oxidase
MAMATAGLITFSPTGTTRRIVERVAQGLGLPETSALALTLPSQGCHEVQEAAFTMALIGAPVYAGRLPPVMVERLRQLDGKGRPAVLIVVYGNRAYEDALLELADEALAAGFRPVAAAAFIGEHAYSTAARPIAQGRPDGADLAQAFRFGGQVAERMRRGDWGSTPLALPGARPGRAPLGVAPAVDENLCVTCGACGAVCPTGAIGKAGPVADGRLCIQCCACIKACPEGARATVDPRILEIAERLHQTCGHRHEPEVYFAT